MLERDVFDEALLPMLHLMKLKTWFTKILDTASKGHQENALLPIPALHSSFAGFINVGEL